MPQSVIDTKITITGLDDAKTKLGEVGATGEAAFGKIGQSTATASEGASGLGSAFEALGEKLGLPMDAIEKFGASLTHLDFTGGVGGLEALGAAIVAAGVAFLALGEHAASATRDIENHARILGMTSEAFEGVLFAAGQVGVGAEAANRGLDRLQVTIGRAREEQEKLANGGKAAFDSTQAIIEQLAAGHTAGIDTLAATADAFVRLTDETAKAALGNKLMGRSWAEQAPLLALGGDAIRALAKRWEDLKISATEAEKVMAGSYAAAANELRMVTEGLGNAFGNIVGQLFTPGMRALSEALSRGQQGVRDFAQAFVDRVRPAMQIVADLIRGFVAALQDMTAIINKVFGTNFSTVMVVATALLVSFARPIVVITGAFLLVEAAAKAVFGPDSPINAEKMAGYVAGFAGFVYMVEKLRVALMAMWATPAGALIVVLGSLVALLVIINTDLKGVSDAVRKYLGDDAANTFDGFVTDIRGLWAAFKGWFVGTLGEVSDAFDNWLDTSDSKLAKLLNILLAIGNAAGAVSAALGITSAAPDIINPGPDFAGATGGRVPGSGSGDIIRAMLTPGEFVHRVAAVRHYGLDFMQRLNNLQIPRFEVGGLVESLRDSFAPTQHFASGGLVGAVSGGGPTHVVNLTIGSETFAGLIAPADVGKKMIAFARNQVVTSAGRKPGWVS